ncbi:unnamed protein product [Brachionus calyciflorus]|uniref:ATP-dependent DNA helicase n=1 Tax=Brachionus calyciflorus TaxID=104777 RepID=A0A813YX36_9BILA|nr:unnamed protein product [Brachionus calyciflorus]
MPSTSTCDVSVQSDLAKLIQKAKLIIWDEALDRSFRDIMKAVNPQFENIPFGNKVILFGGDFRQILPVVKKGNRAQIVNATIKRSEFWKKTRILKLKKKHEREGKKKKNTNDQGLDDLIELPDKLINHFDKETLIKKVYPAITTKPDPDNLINSAILCPTNDEVDKINEIATILLLGETKEYLSSDSIVNDANTAIYPTEFLNTINPPGVPPHRLLLKVGQPIILLRNISSNMGLCNGTRLIVKSLHKYIIHAEIAIGNLKGKSVHIPKVPLIPSDTGLPFEFKRNQFPIRPAFAITINKSQGQTLKKVGI